MKKRIMGLMLAALVSAAAWVGFAPRTAAVSEGGGAVADETPVTKEQVRAEFLHAWNGYKQYAWGHDELKPISKTYRDWYREPLLMTPVDALDTMIIMGLTAEAREDRELIASRLSFDKDMEVLHFEICIRLLGGLLSGYELSGDQRLLALAKDLADRMLPVFDSSTGMPYRMINLKTGKASGSVSGPAQVGTYILEYGTLSKLTGNPVYMQKAKRALTALYQRQSGIGLVGSVIEVNHGWWLVKDSSVGGGIDSYYEYLLKGSILFNDPELTAMWKSSINAINAHLADDTVAGLWYGHAAMKSGRRTTTTFGALDAFFPAALALSGDLDRAKKLEDSCYRMWMVAGIEPEMLDYKRMKIVYPPYPLRPEIIESAYYLYHYTGDEKYRRMGYVFFHSTVKYCRTDAGYATLSDVRTKSQSDSMPSYFLAETLKYYYLLFAAPDDFDFNAVIFNTEAHPLFKNR